MLSMVLNDYRYKLSCNIRSNLMDFLPIIIWSMFSIFIHGEVLNYSLIIVPILIMKQIKNTFGIGISKTLYLSPIDFNGRKAYIKTLILINIIV
ncbi:MAG: hypothetical protein ACI4PU_09350 [Intestinibacter sp.]